MKIESDIATYLGTEACILYAQGFSVISSVIPAFCKRGDVIVAARTANYSIRKGIELSRCTIKWYTPGDVDDLEQAMKQVAQEQAKQKKLTRRFLVAEGLSETTGESIDLPRMVRARAYPVDGSSGIWLTKCCTDRTEGEVQVPHDSRRDLVLRRPWQNRTWCH